MLLPSLLVGNIDKFKVSSVHGFSQALLGELPPNFRNLLPTQKVLARSVAASRILWLQWSLALQQYQWGMEVLGGHSMVLTALTLLCIGGLIYWSWLKLKILTQEHLWLELWATFWKIRECCEVLWL